MLRRQYLKAATGASGACLLAGCVGALEAVTGGGSDRSHELAGSEAWSSRSTASNRTSQRFDAQIELEPGYYLAREFDPQRNVRYGCEWETGGNPMDVLLFDRRTYQRRWRDGDEIQFDSGLSEADTTEGSVSGTLDAGEYVVVFSNSEVLGTKPQGTVRAAVTITSSEV